MLPEAVFFVAIEVKPHIQKYVMDLNAIWCLDYVILVNPSISFQPPV